MANIIDKAAIWILAKASRNVVVSEYHKRSNGKRIDYTRQVTQLNRKEVKDYVNAVMAATDPENPRMSDWYRFRQIFHNDDEVISCAENRYMPIQCAPYKLVDKDGNDDEETKKLLERPWMLDLVKMVVCENFEGVKLICMFELNENGELKEVEEIPQSNFIPQKGIIVDKEYDDTGTSYREGVYKNYYFQVGNDWSLGDYSGLATIVLAKKLALGAWLSYIDKYGVPPIFAITERMDTDRRDELFEMLENFRMNHFAVLQGNEKIETPQGYNVDAYNTFKSLIDEIANKAIRKRLLGSSGLTDEKSFVGSAEVQERILKMKIEVDKLKFKYIFNTEIKPRLIKLSPVYAPLANLDFEYDESESLTLKEILEAIKDLSPYFEFDIEELEKITGLPITKVKSMLGVSLDDPNKEKKEAPKNTDPQKKKDKVNSFSLLGPLAWQTPNLKNTGLVYAATWDKAFDDLIEQIREGKTTATDLDKEFILKTYDRLNKAAQNGYGKGYYNDDVSRKMRENLLRFAATKTHIQQKNLQLYSDSIDNKKQYAEESKKYLNLQNGQYLNVQAAWSARSAQSARQWGEFMRDKDIYGCLKVRTMNDSDVRPAHAILEGFVISLDDPDIDRYIVPFDPNCRCWNEQTRDKPSGQAPDWEPDPQWQGNPGRTGEVFNDDNSYNQQVESNETRLEIRRQAELTKQYLPYNSVINVGENKVYVNDFADTSDMEQNIEAAKKMAESLEKDIYIRHHVDGGIVWKHQNPEFGIGKTSTLGDLKTYNGTSKFNNFVKNNIKDANSQGAQYAVLDISKGGDIASLNNLLRGSLMSQNSNIKRIVIIRGEKVAEITRKQIAARDFSALEGIKEK